MGKLREPLLNFTQRLSSEGQGLLRVQEKEDSGALYALAAPSGPQGHAKLGLATYAHMSSPIRRFSDLFNQHVLFDTIAAAPVVHPVLGPISGERESVRVRARACARECTGGGASGR
jgi:hypothetical protein